MRRDHFVDGQHPQRARLAGRVLDHLLAPVVSVAVSFAGVAVSALLLWLTGHSALRCFSGNGVVEQGEQCDDAGAPCAFSFSCPETADSSLFQAPRAAAT